MFVSPLHFFLFLVQPTASSQDQLPSQGTQFESEAFDSCVWPCHELRTFQTQNDRMQFNKMLCHPHVTVLHICLFQNSDTIIAIKATVYGKREGALTGLLVTSSNSKNIFRNTRAFKTGVIHEVSMLGRQDMVKPENDSWVEQSIFFSLTDCCHPTPNTRPSFACLAWGKSRQKWFASHGQSFHRHTGNETGSWKPFRPFWLFPNFYFVFWMRFRA